MATLVLKLGDRELERHPITKTQTWIGRDQNCDLILDNDAVSRRHAWVAFEDGKFAVYDNESGNGIEVNGVRRENALLSAGSEIHIGKFTIVFLSIGGSEPDTLRTVFHGQAVDDDGISAPTTHLDPEYMVQVRAKLEERARERDNVGRERQRSERISRTQPARPARTNAFMWIVLGILIGAGAAVAVVILRGQ